MNLQSKHPKERTAPAAICEFLLFLALPLCTSQNCVRNDTGVKKHVVIAVEDPPLPMTRLLRPYTRSVAV